MNPFDTTLFHAVNNLSGHIHFIDVLLSFIAQYGLEFYGLFFVIFWFTLPRSNVDARHALVLAVLSGVVALLINLVISHLWLRPRPFAALPKGDYHQLIPHSADASFPSDHGSGGTAMAAATWGTNKWMSRIFTIFTAVMLFARIYVGVHWPTDILASIAVGLFSSWLIRKNSRHFRPVTIRLLRLFHLQKNGLAGRTHG